MGAFAPRHPASHPNARLTTFPRQYHLVYVAYLRSTGLPFHPSLRPQYCLIPHNHSAFTTLQTPKGHRHPLKPTAPPTIVNNGPQSCQDTTTSMHTRRTPHPQSTTAMAAATAELPVCPCRKTPSASSEACAA